MIKKIPLGDLFLAFYRNHELDLDAFLVMLSHHEVKYRFEGCLHFGVPAIRFTIWTRDRFYFYESQSLRDAALAVCEEMLNKGAIWNSMEV